MSTVDFEQVNVSWVVLSIETHEFLSKLTKSARFGCWSTSRHLWDDLMNIHSNHSFFKLVLTSSMSLGGTLA